jgi:hypothetical protein
VYQQSGDDGTVDDIKRLQLASDPCSSPEAMREVPAMRMKQGMETMPLETSGGGGRFKGEHLTGGA